MDLIEKAAQKLKRENKASLVERAAKKLSRSDNEAVPVDGGDQPVVPHRRKIVTPPAGRRSRREEIDLEALDSQGMITPVGEPSQIAEEFRVIKRSLLAKAFDKRDRGIKNSNLILVSSAQPGEGKTFCAVNLAMSVASERDLTVLLVDADFANPSVLQNLGLSGGNGLFDVIDDENIDLADCLIRTNLDNLSVLPAGRRHSLTTELLASDRMRDIADEIVMRYPDRLIIFDSPPVLASSAPGTLASFVGQILFVVEADKTTASQVKAALMQINACENVSLILNKNRLASGSEMFASYYTQYYGHHKRTA
ncbi:MAG: XrtA-associated tyrosine autokinase [Sphingomonadales bacterium]